MRTIGVEEELLLVQSGSGRALSMAGQVIRRAAAIRDDASADAIGGSLGKELQQQQIETDTAPHTDLAELDADVRAWRRTAIDAAHDTGAQVAALGTCPVPVEPRTYDDDRFRDMADRFGITTTQNLTCACHVHVAVESRDEAIAVIDRIRPWLPILIAVSANSPFWQGEDTGYASYRTQAQSRWPTAGPTEMFGSARAYDELVESMVATGTVLDSAMLYFDARPSERYPTVEIRVADVCLDVTDTVLIAGLARGLVTTAAAEWADGKPAAPAPVALLRLANWQASRAGLTGALLDPGTHRPRPARDVVGDLLEHVRPALRDSGDERSVTDAVERLLERGTGADRQRATYARTGGLADVVAEAVRITAGQES